MSENNPLDMLKSLLGGEESSKQVDDLINSFGNSQSQNNSQSNNNMQMLDKMRRMMEMMENTRNDSRANLLNSLKPYLSQDRCKKVDKCIELLGISQILKIMKDQRDKEE